jgi:hypothetical protein
MVTCNKPCAKRVRERNTFFGSTNHIARGKSNRIIKQEKKKRKKERKKVQPPNIFFQAKINAIADPRKTVRMLAETEDPAPVGFWVLVLVAPAPGAVAVGAP